MEKYGHVGVSLYHTLSKIKTLRLVEEKFLKIILDFYIRNYNKNTSDSLYSLKQMIENMPTLDSLYKLLSSEQIEKKELIVIKLILDIYEHYFKKFDHPLFCNLINEYVPTASLFYSLLTDNDISLLNNYIKKKDMSEILFDKMRTVKLKNKSDILMRLNKLRMDYMCFTGNICVNKFVN